MQYHFEIKITKYNVKVDKIETENFMIESHY